MEIQQLRVFLAVAEELHFGRAAARLHMAQPPVSRIVRQLERDLGIDLFIRSTRSVQLTAAGVALTASAREILAATERAQASALAAGRGSWNGQLAYAGASTHVLVEFAREVRNPPRHRSPPNAGLAFRPRPGPPRRSITGAGPPASSPASSWRNTW
jgi:DNA-binding transcriptional LysR family regulator